VARRILIVDDSNTILMAAKMLLREYDVVVARDGEEALEKVAAEKPDLILLDLVMPKVDGIEVCRRLREESGLADLPIIMLTTRGEPQNIEAGYEAGCTEYLTKPFDGSDLLTRVRAFLGE